MSLDEPQTDDQVEKINGVQVAIEQGLIEYTSNLALDYQEYRGFMLSGMRGC